MCKITSVNPSSEEQLTIKQMRSKVKSFCDLYDVIISKKFKNAKTGPYNYDIGDISTCSESTGSLMGEIFTGLNLKFT